MTTKSGFIENVLLLSPFYKTKIQNFILKRYVHHNQGSEFLSSLLLLDYECMVVPKYLVQPLTKISKIKIFDYSELFKSESFKTLLVYERGNHYPLLTQDLSQWTFVKRAGRRYFALAREGIQEREEPRFVSKTVSWIGFEVL